MNSLRTPLRVGLLAVPALLLVGACGIGSTADEASAPASDSSSGSGGSTSSPGGARDLAQPPDAGKATDSSEVGGDTGQKGSPAAATVPINRAIVASGQVSLHAKSLLKARSEVLRLTTSWNGQVADEQTNADDKGRIVDSTITLRVPTPKFSEAMTAIGGLGEVEQTSRSTEDVTTQVIDNQARIRAAERSIRQIERLLDRATQLSDIIAIESDLARRQADLDSLKQQQAYLSDQTSLSTINVYLTRSMPGHEEPDEATGFLAGLADGWHALRASTLVVLQVVGAVLPFGVVVLLLGVPAWLLLRSRRHATPVTISEG